DFIGKEEMPEGISEVLGTAAQRLCARGKATYIQPSDLLAAIRCDFSDHNVIAAEDEIEDILVRLFPEANRLEVETFHPEQATWNVSSVPRPKNVILRVAETVDGVRRQPKVVKLARAEKMETEVRRFYKHINGRLVGTYHPTLEKNAILWNLGGAVYTMLGEASEGVRQFSNVYSHEPPEVIQPILSQFFGETWSDLYTTTREYIEASLFTAYCTVWGDKWFNERVKGFSKRHAKDWMQTGDWPEYTTPEPMQWLIDQVDRTTDASRLPQVGMAATHGDLHGDNLLIDRNNHAWVIDFERSGPGPILQDLIELEADILNRLTCNSFNRADFYRLCILVLREEDLQPNAETTCLSSPEARKALDVITFLRRLAGEYIHPQSDAREYLWGLLFNALFRASISDVNTDHCLDRPLRLAGMICHRLEHWGAPWPPTNWPTID
ncbi:MAG TPA: phosphotransferase, partial [Anaerolineales bacterium]|nr:phosphotransferase [Anaerolineales bacterium]